jgi:hypothetical protein
LKPFSDIRRNLGDVQIRYGRHLSSKITERLIKIQNLIESIENTYEMDIRLSKLKDQSPFFRELTRKVMPNQTDLKSLDDLIQYMLSSCIKSLIQETYELWKMGIEFDLFG